jgi:hypothetical protein
MRVGMSLSCRVAEKSGAAGTGWSLSLKTIEKGVVKTL